jgi:Cysteine rich repeat
VKGIRMFRSSLFAAFLVGLTVSIAAAQQPTEAQRDAIRSACRSDFIAHCSSVQPGGKEAFECLLQNESKLSAACKTAVSAVAPKTETPAAATAPAVATPAASPAETAATPSPTPAAATPAAAPASREPTPAKKPEPTRTTSAPTTTEKPTAKQASAIGSACRSDFIANCSGVQPGGADALACLQRNEAKLSTKCRTAVAAISKGASPAADTGGGTEPAAPAAAAPAPTTAAAPTKPTAAQTSAIRSACRSDFMSHCSGVQPGGAEALQCLQSNAASLSPACKTAVAAIGGGPAAPPAAASPTAAAPTVAPLSPMPLMLPRRALAILAVCDTDARSLCAGIPPGGGRIIECLADHAPSLSSGCYSAMAAARR